MAAAIKQRLADLDALLAEGVITPAEHADARRAALGIPNPAAEPAASSSPKAAVNASGEAVVVGQVMPGTAIIPGGVPTSITDKLCRKDHQMALIQNTTAMPGNEQNRNTARLICSSCWTVIGLGEHYYMCGQCTIPFCSRCVTENRHLQYSKEWSTGLLACHRDPGSCFDTFACTYCFQYMMCDRVMRGFDTTPSPENVVESGCTGSVVLWGCGFFWYDVSVVFLGNIFSCTTRDIAARRYGIEEHGCTSCMIGYFCRCCSDAQVHREMTIRGHFPGGVCAAVKPNLTLMGQSQTAVVPIAVVSRPRNATLY